jgi:hypothetical protein
VKLKEGIAEEVRAVGEDFRRRAMENLAKRLQVCVENMGDTADVTLRINHC